MSLSTLMSAPRSSVAACTEVKTEHFSYDWVIKRFKFLPQKPREAIYSPIFCTNNEVEWRLRLIPRGYAGDENNVRFDLRLHSPKSETSAIGVHIEVSILPTGFKTTLYETYPTKLLFGKGCEIHRSILCDHDVITIHIEMDIPLEAITESIGTSQLMLQAFDCQEGQWTRDFRKLFEEPKFSDLDVIVGTQKFPAHKGVLATRSPVFAAMFEHKEMQENLENEVKIEKMEPEVVKAMLEFIYTDEVTNLEELASGLLEAADKYDLPRLRSMCEKILYQKLNYDNAAEILIHADLHRSYKLKEYVIKFMCDHFFEVLQTDGYKEMMGKYPPLMDELMLAIAIRMKTN